MDPRCNGPLTTVRNDSGTHTHGIVIDKPILLWSISLINEVRVKVLAETYFHEWNKVFFHMFLGPRLFIKGNYRVILVLNASRKSAATSSIKRNSGIGILTIFWHNGGALSSLSV